MNHSYRNPKIHVKTNSSHQASEWETEKILKYFFLAQSYIFFSEAASGHRKDKLFNQKKNRQDRVIPYVLQSPPRPILPKPTRSKNPSHPTLHKLATTIHKTKELKNQIDQNHTYSNKKWKKKNKQTFPNQEKKKQIKAFPKKCYSNSSKKIYILKRKDKTRLQPGHGRLGWGRWDCRRGRPWRKWRPESSPRTSTKHSLCTRTNAWWYPTITLLSLPLESSPV